MVTKQLKKDVGEVVKTAEMFIVYKCLELRSAGKSVSVCQFLVALQKINVVVTNEEFDWNRGVWIVKLPCTCEKLFSIVIVLHAKRFRTLSSYW